MDGALMEVGPYRLKDEETLEYNKGSWDEFANLLFVDQPVGTGFSYANTDSYLHELDEMSTHFMIFLSKFFDMFPEYERDDVRDSMRRGSFGRAWLLTHHRSTLQVNRTLVSIFHISRRPSRNATRQLWRMERANGR